LASENTNDKRHVLEEAQSAASKALFRLAIETAYILKLTKLRDARLAHIKAEESQSHAYFARLAGVAGRDY